MLNGLCSVYVKVASLNEHVAKEERYSRTWTKNALIYHLQARAINI